MNSPPHSTVFFFLLPIAISKQTEKGHLRGEDPYEESIRFHRQRDAGEEEENPKLILQSKKCKKFMREVDDKVKKYNDFSVDDMVKFFCNPARVESMAKKVQECAKKQAAKEKDSCAKAYEQMVGNTKNQVIHALHSKKSCEEEVRREMAYVKATSKKKAGWRDKAHGLVKGVKGSLSKGLDNAKGTFSTGLNKMKNMFGGSGGEDGKDNA